MSIFYVKNEQINGDKAVILGGDVKHIRDVLRYNVSDTLDICDDDGIRYTTKIAAFDKETVFLDVLEKSDFTTEPSINVTLFQGMPKADKLELIIQKTTELGVSTVVPVVTERTVVRFDEKDINKKVERWNKIAQEAGKQSGRQKIPVVEKPIKLKNLIENISKYDILLLPYECEKEMTLKAVLRNLKEKCKNVAIFIGPEGGFSEEEVGLLSKLENVKIVTLGPRILRTETAGIATVATVLYELQD